MNKATIFLHWLCLEKQIKRLPIPVHTYFSDKNMDYIIYCDEPPLMIQGNIATGAQNHRRLENVEQDKDMYKHLSEIADSLKRES